MPTPNFDLTCLQDASYAAVALLMQDLATDIDAVLAAQLAAFNDFLAAPTAVAISTAATTTVSLSTQTPITTFTSQFLNYTIPANPFGFTLASGDIGFPDADTAVWYHVGGYAKLQATGAVTLNSIRQLTLTVSSLIVDPSGATNLGQWEVQSYDTNTGGEFLTVDGVVRIPSGSKATARMTFLHGNAASSVSATTGSLLWLTRLSDDDTIGAP